MEDMPKVPIFGLHVVYTSKLVLFSEVLRRACFGAANEYCQLKSSPLTHMSTRVIKIWGLLWFAHSEYIWIPEFTTNSQTSCCRMLVSSCSEAKGAQKHPGHIVSSGQVLTPRWWCAALHGVGKRRSLSRKLGWSSSEQKDAERCRKMLSDFHRTVWKFTNVLSCFVSTQAFAILLGWEQSLGLHNEWIECCCSTTSNEGRLSIQVIS